MSIWRKDANVNDLEDQPRWFIEALLRGEDEEVAATRAGVTLADVRRWSSDRAFRGLLKRARQGIGRTQVILGDGRGPGQGALRDATVTIHPDGSVEEVSNLHQRTPGQPGQGLDAKDWPEYQMRIERGEDRAKVLAEIRGRVQAGDSRVFGIERGEDK